METIKGAYCILITNQERRPIDASLRRFPSTQLTSAGAACRIEVVLMGAAVILAFSEEQHFGRVAAGRTNPSGVTCQALSVAGCQKQEKKGPYEGRGRHKRRGSILTPAANRQRFSLILQPNPFYFFVSILTQNMQCGL